jgi:hypothetical protein
MRFRWAAALLLGLLYAPRVPAVERFDALATGAQRIDALEPFLSRFVGRCTDVYERQTCEANVRAARQAFAGKTFAVRISDAAPLVRAELQGDGFLLLVTPFVDGGGIALTHGAPARQDAAGNPLVSRIPIRGKLPDGMLSLDFQGPFRTGAIELEIVFRPEKPWKLRRKGESGHYEGVAARFLGVRVVDARTGSVIASRVL